MQIQLTPRGRSDAPHRGGPTRRFVARFMLQLSSRFAIPRLDRPLADEVEADRCWSGGQLTLDQAPSTMRQVSAPSIGIRISGIRAHSAPVAPHHPPEPLWWRVVWDDRGTLFPAPSAGSKSQRLSLRTPVVLTVSIQHLCAASAHMTPRNDRPEVASSESVQRLEIGLG
jgi:hypothetical protein